MVQLYKQADKNIIDGEKVEGLSGPSANVHYIPLPELPKFLLLHEGRTLALLFYGKGFKPRPSYLHPTIHIDLPQLSGSPLAEVWTSTAPLRRFQEHQFHATMNDQVVFGSLHCKEPGAGGLKAAAYLAYRNILRLTQKLKYPNLLRIWNYFPSINLEQDGLERYKLFCIGRYQAFQEYQDNFGGLLPAATTVGTNSGALQVFFLAGKNKGQHFENPRQVSAYHYPPLHGPRSPSFARATLEETGLLKRLFIAGTSSIVGHTTQHKGDPSEQTKETLCNLEALIKQPGIATNNRKRDFAGNDLMKVYIRNPDDLKKVQNILGEQRGAATHILYLKGDLCRRELLVEIEGLLEIQ